MTVMVGVSLVGLSASLAEASPGITRLLARAVVGEAPQESTTVFVGGSSIALSLPLASL